MKIMTRIIGSIKSQLAALAAMIALGAAAAPSVMIVSAQQRYPWNGLVDVTYTLSGIEEGQNYELRFEVTPPGGTALVSDPATGATYRNGTWTATFNAATMLPETFAKGCSLRAVLACYEGPSDATGTPLGIFGDVMIIDVSGGANAAIYPVTYFTNVDIGRFNCSVYKTEKLVLRKVTAGSYVVGDDSEKNNPRRTVTTRGFYLGVFEVTQQQYQKVTGTNPSGFNQDSTDENAAPLRPVENMSWEVLRDSAAPEITLQPNGSSDSFLKRLLAKAQDASGAVLGFDLPTEVQWEIACRAGTTTCFYWGDDEADIGQYACCSINAGAKTHAVGGKQPNAWGFFDMAGNVMEWCRDAFVGIPKGERLDADEVATPRDEGSSSNRVYRNGGWNNDAKTCHSSYRRGFYMPSRFNTLGFRLSRDIP